MSVHPSDDFNPRPNGLSQGGGKVRVNDTTIDVGAHSPSLQVYNCMVDVVRPVRVNTSTGQQETVVAIASNWLCAIRWKSGAEKILFDKKSYFLDAVLTCRVIPGETVKVTDRIVYLDDVFEIVDLMDINNLGRRLRIALRRVA